MLYETDSLTTDILAREDDLEAFLTSTKQEYENEYKDLKDDIKMRHEDHMAQMDEAFQVVKDIVRGGLQLDSATARQSRKKKHRAQVSTPGLGILPANDAGVDWWLS